jgi:recombination associated protein RdgC
VAITWQDKIECVIDDKLSIKRLKFSELVHEQADNSQGDDAAAQFDADFAIMSSEFKDFISDLIQAFGGFSNINDNLADELIVAALKED